MRLRTASEPITLDATSEAPSLRHTNDVHVISNLKNVDEDTLPLLDVIILA
jgi:hypothetical protein